MQTETSEESHTEAGPEFSDRRCEFLFLRKAHYRLCSTSGRRHDEHFDVERLPVPVVLVPRKQLEYIRIRAEVSDYSAVTVSGIQYNWTRTDYRKLTLVEPPCLLSFSHVAFLPMCLLRSAESFARSIRA